MLKMLASRSVLAWCVIRDFNDMMYTHEKMEGGGGEVIQVIC